LTRLISFLFGCLAQARWPGFLVQFVIRSFVAAYKIDLSKAKKTKFKSLNDMFTREIKKDFSLYEKNSFIHPAEAVLISYGEVKNNQTFLVKGKNYSATELLGREENLEGYHFYNYYLSPQDYHRVHHPVSGKYLHCKEIKGPLYPVAPWFIKLVPSVFAKNYRTVSLVESPKFGKVFTVMVGALNVGSLKMKRGLFEGGSEDIKVGEELGIFEMGSSVVVFTKKKLDVSEGRVFFEAL
jgi:phosphatidylserine decarboxylase